MSTDIPSYRLPGNYGKADPAKVTIDTAAVKAGDSVTLENGETSVRGPVTNIEHATHTDIVVGFAIENIGWRYIEADVVAQQDAGVWTLTAHQPAPKPEWKPGTTGTATLNNLVSGNAALGLRAMRTLRDGVYGFALENGLSITDGATTYSVSDFVPDSSKTTVHVTKVVTQEELADALAQQYGDHASLAAVPEQSTRQNYLSDARSILALLGGESR